MKSSQHARRSANAIRIRGILPWLALLFALRLPAIGQTNLQTAVAPANLATNDSAFGSGTFSGLARVQQVYAAEHFPPGALHITELRFRPDYLYGFAFSTVVTLDVRLSTTVQNAEALSPDFGENPGADEVEVFNGSLILSSSFNGPPTGPKEFDIVIPLRTPFVYQPANGNLLVDIRNASGSEASPLSGQSVEGDGASRLVGFYGSAYGFADPGVDALQIVYEPTNAPALDPLRLTRGPYLQLTTTSNGIVRWRTHRPAERRVRFGLAAEALDWEIAEATPLTNEHIVTLTNLAPGTRYFYAIGTAETNLAGGADYYFWTAPTSSQPVRLWAIGDSGTANQPGYFGLAARVRDAYLNFAGARRTDVWLMLGDNAYLNGTDQQYQDTLFNIYPTLLRTTALWPTIGNHDVTALGARPYTDIFSLPINGEAGGIASGSESYYSFDYGNVHFVCLDSETSLVSPAGPMLTWLNADLAANTNDWLIAFWHRPPISFGTHNSDAELRMVEMRQVVIPVLESNGVDLVLTGHSHNYERSYLLDGHYGHSTTFAPSMVKDSGSGRTNDTGAYRKPTLGPGANEGAVYVVCGSSGWVTPDTIIPQYLHPAMFIKRRELGSLVIDVNSNRLDAIFLRETGGVDDYFTIIKGGPAEPFRLATFRVTEGTVRAQWKSEAGRNYRVQVATRLRNPDWTDASLDILAYGATTGWTNSAGPSGEHNFFRVVRMD